MNGCFYGARSRSYPTCANKSYSDLVGILTCSELSSFTSTARSISLRSHEKSRRAAVVFWDWCATHSSPVVTTHKNKFFKLVVDLDNALPYYTIQINETTLILIGLKSDDQKYLMLACKQMGLQCIPPDPPKRGMFCCC